MNNYILTGAMVVLALAIALPLSAQSYVKVADHPVILPDETELGSSIKAKWHVLGWGTDREDAIHDALNKASEIVGSYVSRHTSSPAWKPEIGWIREHLTDFKSTPPNPLPEENIVIPTRDQEITALCYTVTVTISNRDWTLLQQEQRRFFRRQYELAMRQRSLPRVIMAAKILAVAVIGLFLVVGVHAVRNKCSKSH